MYSFFIISLNKKKIKKFWKKNWTFTKAPITPKLATLKFSNGFYLVDVFKKGYKNKGICAKENKN